jgi:hypothetical protein
MTLGALASRPRTFLDVQTFSVTFSANINNASSPTRDACAAPSMELRCAGSRALPAADSWYVSPSARLPPME